MSTYRPLERMRWYDERLMTVSPVARAIWDYLCSNPQDDACGLYRLSMAALCEDTGWAPEQAEEAMRELEAIELIARDEQVRLVWVRNMLRKSYPNPSPQQRKAVRRHLESLPRSPLIGRLCAYYLERFEIDLGVDTAVFDTLCDRVSGEGISDSEIGLVRYRFGLVRFGSDRFGSPEEPSEKPAPDEQPVEDPPPEPTLVASPKPSPRRNKPKSAKLALEHGPATEVLEHLNAAVKRLNPRSTGFTPTRTNLEHIGKRLAEGEHAETLKAVIDARAAQCERNIDELQYLNPSTPFRDRNWAINRGVAERWQASHPDAARERNASGWDALQAESDQRQRQLDGHAGGEP